MVFRDDSNNMKNQTGLQAGQTLIETIAAIFILTTALTAGLALTIYVFSNSQKGISEIVASNLAREGIDMVRNMRDTNWLESVAKSVNSPSDNPPWDLGDCAIDASTFKCYAYAWRGVPGGSFHGYDLEGTNSGYISNIINLNFGGSSFSIDGGPSSYALYLQPDGSYRTNITNNSVYSRKILLNHNINPPFSDVRPYGLSELVVTSIVGWTGRGCKPMTGTPPDPSTTNCSTSITERLTNWKDYK
jgi:hypothetical protein